MAGSIADWHRLYRQAYEHLKPGGWIEMQEFETEAHSDDGTLETTKYIRAWQQQINEASRQFGKCFNEAPTQKQRLIDAGFVDVRDDIYKVCFVLPLYIYKIMYNHYLAVIAHTHLSKILIDPHRPLGKRLPTQRDRPVQPPRHARVCRAVHPRGRHARPEAPQGGGRQADRGRQGRVPERQAPSLRQDALRVRAEAGERGVMTFIHPRLNLNLTVCLNFKYGGRGGKRKKRRQRTGWVKLTILRHDVHYIYPSWKIPGFFWQEFLT